MAASAAYPLLLPAINRQFDFQKNGKKNVKRVTLTDGGIYENLGITPLFPDRSPEFGYAGPKVNLIVACDADHGPTFHSANFQLMYTRISGCFESLMKRIQASNFKILHKFKDSGEIQGFVLSYLGQVDERLPTIPKDLIRREDIIGYPTNFFAMDDKNIEKLSMRGEQLTTLLAGHYLS